MISSRGVVPSCPAGSRGGFTPELTKDNKVELLLPLIRDHLLLNPEDVPADRCVRGPLAFLVFLRA